MKDMHTLARCQTLFPGVVAVRSACFPWPHFYADGIPSCHAKERNSLMWFDVLEELDAAFASVQIASGNGRFISKLDRWFVQQRGLANPISSLSNRIHQF